MKAAVYHDRGDVRIEEVPDPAPADDELLLEVHAVGICGTDAAEWRHGPTLYAVPGPDPVTGHRGPMIPGHELSGRVVAAGRDARGFAEGAVVACGAGYVRAGERAERPTLAPSYATVGLQRDGGLAQFVAVPARTCIDVTAQRMSDDTAALAQPMAIAVHSLRRGRPGPGARVAVVGAGGIGAFLIFAAASLGLEVIAADLDPERLRIASDLGAAATVSGDELSGIAAAVDVVYEVTGSERGLAAALDLAALAGGRVVLTGLHERPRTLDVRRVTLREIELIGTNAHVCDVDLPEAVRLLARRGSGWADVAPTAFPLEALVEHGLAPIADGSPRHIKTLIDPWAVRARPTMTATVPG